MNSRRPSNWHPEPRASVRATLIACGLALMSGCQLPAHDQAKQQADERWREVRARVKLQLGRQQIDGGLFEDAVTTLSEAANLDPTCAETYALLAQSNLELGKLASADQILQAARSRGLESAELHYFQGVVYEQRNQVDDALVEYGRSFTLDQSQVDPLVAQAECLVAVDRAAEALELLEANLDRFDDNATVTTLAGHVAARLGNHVKAATYLTRASLLAGDDPRVIEPLALQLVELKRCEQAAPLLTKLLDIAERDSGTARCALANCRLQQSEPAAAIELLSDYTRRRPEDDAALLLLAQAYVEADDPVSAQRTLDKVRPPRRRAPDAVLVAAAIEWRRAEFAAAADRLYTLLEDAPANSAAYRLLAQVLRDQNLPDEARDCDERAERLQITQGGS